MRKLIEGKRRPSGGRRSRSTSAVHAILVCATLLVTHANVNPTLAEEPRRSATSNRVFPPLPDAIARRQQIDARRSNQGLLTKMSSWLVRRPVVVPHEVEGAEVDTDGRIRVRVPGMEAQGPLMAERNANDELILPQETPLRTVTADDPSDLDAHQDALATKIPPPASNLPELPGGVAASPSVPEEDWNEVDPNAPAKPAHKNAHADDESNPTKGYSKPGRYQKSSVAKHNAGLPQPPGLDSKVAPAIAKPDAPAQVTPGSNPFGTTQVRHLPTKEELEAAEAKLAAALRAQTAKGREEPADDPLAAARAEMAEKARQLEATTTPAVDPIEEARKELEALKLQKTASSPIVPPAPPAATNPVPAPSVPAKATDEAIPAVVPPPPISAEKTEAAKTSAVPTKALDAIELLADKGPMATVPPSTPPATQMPAQPAVKPVASDIIPPPPSVAPSTSAPTKTSAPAESVETPTPVAEKKPEPKEANVAPPQAAKEQQGLSFARELLKGDALPAPTLTKESAPAAQLPPAPSPTPVEKKAEIPTPTTNSNDSVSPSLLTAIPRRKPEPLPTPAPAMKPMDLLPAPPSPPPAPERPAELPKGVVMPADKPISALPADPIPSLEPDQPNRSSREIMTTAATAEVTPTPSAPPRRTSIPPASARTESTPPPKSGILAQFKEVQPVHVMPTASPTPAKWEASSQRWVRAGSIQLGTPASKNEPTKKPAPTAAPTSEDKPSSKVEGKPTAWLGQPSILSLEHLESSIVKSDARL